ncbi:MAG: efflux RND transporter permease subunit [candidate division KSB1 bacterium]|nr:efflux RND transporter permease subunit [candidate division KSB1 bacterium]MDZ7300662.1 efflux RND transporter permease subunit [candidate division KSB1 bacterium]MDZ7309799.1 efflux RND transporter permease subunit [candidate division KSB1 bacterium]
MTNITETSLRRPVTTLMIFACFIVIGAISAKLLPLEYFPDVDFPGIWINIPYPGSTPEEVERQIVRPIEEVLGTISGIKSMNCNANEGSADIQLRFDWSEDTALKAMEVHEKIDGIRDQLPGDVERIYVNKFSASDMALLNVRISSNRDLSNAYDMLNRNLKRRLERIEGVSKVDLYGVEKKQIRIELLADRITAHRVDLNRLAETLRRSNFSVTAGRITDANRRFVVRPIGEFKSVEEYGDLIIGEHNLRLRDIANIAYDHPKRDYGRHLDRRYAIGLDVFKEAGANTVSVANRVISEIEEISKNPEMEGIKIFYMDNMAEGIVSSLNELLKSGLWGAALAILVLYFFLRRFASTLIVALAIPFSLLATMALLYFLGMSLNILTMMGLMLAVGMLVDNAVVVTESIYRHQQLNGDMHHATLIGVKEVALAITAGTMTTAIVFLPNIVSPRDEISIYMKHVATTICLSLGASLLIAMTIVPLLAKRFPSRHTKEKPNIIGKLLNRYSKILDWTLRHRKTSVGLIFLTLASVAVPISFVKKDMFPPQEDRRLRLFYHINGNYRLEKVEEAVDTIEEYLFAHKEEFEIKSLYTYYNTGFASTTILLKKDEEGAQKSQETIREEIRTGLPKLAIANPSFDWRRNSGGAENVRIQVAGESSERLAELSREIARLLEKIPGFKDVRSEAEAGAEEVRVIVDRERARQYGYSTQEIANTIAAAMRGQNLRRFRNQDGEIDVRLQLQETDHQTLEHLRNLPLFNGNSQPTKLATLADFRVQRGPSNIHREDRTTVIGISANLQGITMNDARKKISQALKQFNFPPGYAWNFGQSFNYEEQTGKTMLTNTLLALALIYFVMAALFESLLFPAAIWTSIIFAVIGVWWFFMITSTTFSLMAWIGVLILMGVVVNNGIVLIDRVNQLRAAGRSRHDAIVQAGRDRLRPILMTTGTTVLGLLPLCIGNTQIGGDGPPYFPMARAIVGGLFFSTFITLLVLPTIYVLLDELRSWARGIVRRAKVVTVL